MAMEPLRDDAHLASAHRCVGRKKALGHNPAAVGLMKQRTTAMTACGPAGAEMSRTTAVGIP